MSNEDWMDDNWVFYPGIFSIYNHALIVKYEQLTYLLDEPLIEIKDVSEEITDKFQPEILVYNPEDDWIEIIDYKNKGAKNRRRKK